MKNLSKILTGGALIYGAIAFVLWIFLVRSDEPGKYIDMLMYMTYFVFAAAVALTLVFSIKNMLTDASKMKYMAKYIIGFVVVFGLSYVLANGDLTQVGELTITEGASKMVGAGLYAFYILITVTFATIVYSGVKGLFSK